MNIINYPWILESDGHDPLSQNYYFSNIDRNFRISILKITKINRDVIGIIIIQQRNKRLTLPYAYYNNKYSKDIMTAIVQYFLKSNCEKMLLYNETLISHLKNINPPLMINNTKSRREFKREFLISNYFNVKDLKGKLIQDGCGDAAFT